MTEIRVGATVTLNGKIELRDEATGLFRVALTNGPTIWMPRETITNFQNPEHPEPASGFALLDGKIAWSDDSKGWETEHNWYDSWHAMIEAETPGTITELVPKDTTVSKIIAGENS